MPHQLKRLATRVALGVGRSGGFGGNSSGDIFVAFSTANPGGPGVNGAILPTPSMGGTGGGPGVAAAPVITAARSAVAVRDTTVAGALGTRRARVYTPASAPASRGAKAKLPQSDLTPSGR